MKRPSLPVYLLFWAALLLSAPLTAGTSLKPLKPFDWTQVMQSPSSSAPFLQTLSHHRLFGIFSAVSKPYEQNSVAREFITQYFKEAQALTSDAAVLRFASDSVALPEGFYIEIGTGTGRTSNFIAALNPEKILYTFDSFTGLPEAWQREDITFKAGSFAFNLKGPFAFTDSEGTYISVPLLRNVIAYPGIFRETLPLFKAQILKDKPIAFLFIDSDIYQSAHECLEIFADNLISGTVIVFDEGYNYPNCEKHEWRAFQEFLLQRQLSFEPLAFNRFYEQLAIRLKR